LFYELCCLLVLEGVLHGGVDRVGLLVVRAEVVLRLEVVEEGHALVVDALVGRHARAEVVLPLVGRAVLDDGLLRLRGALRDGLCDGLRLDSLGLLDGLGRLNSLGRLLEELVDLGLGRLLGRARGGGLRSASLVVGLLLVLGHVGQLLRRARGLGARRADRARLLVGLAVRRGRVGLPRLKGRHDRRLVNLRDGLGALVGLELLDGGPKRGGDLRATADRVDRLLHVAVLEALAVGLQDGPDDDVHEVDVAVTRHGALRRALGLGRTALLGRRAEDEGLHDGLLVAHRQGLEELEDIVAGGDLESHLRAWGLVHADTVLSKTAENSFQFFFEIEHVNFHTS